MIGASAKVAILILCTGPIPIVYRVYKFEYRLPFSDYLKCLHDPLNDFESFNSVFIFHYLFHLYTPVAICIMQRIMVTF